METTKAVLVWLWVNLDTLLGVAVIVYSYAKLYRMKWADTETAKATMQAIEDTDATEVKQKMAEIQGALPKDVQARINDIVATVDVEKATPNPWLILLRELLRIRYGAISATKTSK